MAAGEAVTIHAFYGVPDEAPASSKGMQERMRRINIRERWDDMYSCNSHGDRDEEAEASLKDMLERMSQIQIPEDSDSYGAAIARRKIHRFPQGLRGIGGSDERYIVPTVVAIGPYYHGKPHLQKMEEVKLAAVKHFFAKENGASIGDVYGKILSVVGDARGCYADENTVGDFSDAKFAALMLVDGCFLLKFMLENREKLFEGRALSSEYSILKDMMLLENQVPWLVLQALMEFLPVEVEVRSFVADVGDLFLRKKGYGVSLSTSCFSVLFKVTPNKSLYLMYKEYKPANLLDLLRFSQIFLMLDQADRQVALELGGSSLLSSSAVELAQIGVNLTASTAVWFGDMSVKRGPVYGELSLSPMFLNDVTTSWLVNMAALEASGDATAQASAVVSSYLSVVAMLMDREEDVHQLRAKQVLYSTMSNAQTLDFFKRIGQHLGFGHRYFYVLHQIDKYKHDRPVRIFLNKLLYNSYKTMTIASLFSIVGVLVGIFKTLLSNKKQQ